MENSQFSLSTRLEGKTQLRRRHCRCYHFNFFSSLFRLLLYKHTHIRTHANFAAGSTWRRRGPDSRSVCCQVKKWSDSAQGETWNMDGWDVSVVGGRWKKKSWKVSRTAASRSFNFNGRERRIHNSPKKVISTVKFCLTAEAFLRQRRVTLAASYAGGMPASF